MIDAALAEVSRSIVRALAPIIVQKIREDEAMAFGPGTHDDEVTDLRTKTHADGVLLLIVNGSKGSGFAAQLSLELTLNLPAILRDIARQIEERGPDA